MPQTPSLDISEKTDKKTCNGYTKDLYARRSNSQYSDAMFPFVIPLITVRNRNNYNLDGVLNIIVFLISELCDLYNSDIIGEYPISQNNMYKDKNRFNKRGSINYYTEFPIPEEKIKKLELRNIESDPTFKINKNKNVYTNIRRSSYIMNYSKMNDSDIGNVLKEPFCSVCDTRVSGQYTACYVCGHGGHPSHLYVCIYICMYGCM